MAWYFDESRDLYWTPSSLDGDLRLRSEFVREFRYLAARMVGTSPEQLLGAAPRRLSDGPGASAE